MKQNIYKIILLAIGLIFFAAALYVYRPVQNKTTRITVVGDSQTKLMPDTAVITFSVVTQNKQAVDAQQENARKSEAVKQAVEAITNDAGTEIKTSDYSLSPEQNYYSEKMPKIVGYEVKNTVTISINDLNQVGAVIDAATRSGANSVEGIQFVLSETSLAQGGALALATKQAMAKAEAIAQSLNGRIVRIVESHESGAPLLPSSSYNEYATMAANSNAMPAKPMYNTPVEAGSLNVRSQVILVVEVEVKS